MVANGTLAKQLAREKVLRQRSVDTSAKKYKHMEQDLEKAIEAQDNAEEALKEFINEGRERIAIRVRAWNDKFVRHARTLLSTGGSAKSTLERKRVCTVPSRRAIYTMVSVSP
jgi:hypothetical protein